MSWISIKLFTSIWVLFGSENRSLAQDSFRQCLKYFVDIDVLFGWYFQEIDVVLFS